MPPSFARRYMGQLVTSCPASVTLPASGSIMPHAMRNVVVLPAPLGPNNPTISPGLTSKSTPSTTRRRPYDFTNPRTSSSATMQVLHDLGSRATGRESRARNHLALDTRPSTLDLLSN